MGEGVRHTLSCWPTRDEQPAHLMGHESVEITKSFYAVFEQDDLRQKHDQFSNARWKDDNYSMS
jgi:hypothetical protein